MAVRLKLDEAAQQARQYGATLREHYGLSELHGFAVVTLVADRLLWRAVA